jgi:PilZ domain
MPRKRRSGRITKEIPIVLLGTDATGKVFSEETNTVVLSRHGAGVVTRYRFSPDELLTLRLPGTAKEAAIRLVGQIGGEPGRYIYGVTFVDPDPDFWPMEFPPPDPFEPASERIALECSMCQTRVDMEQGDIEEDVYAVNGNILRFCTECGTSTPWKKATSEAPSTSATIAAKISSGVPVPLLAAPSEAPHSKIVPALAARPAKLNFNTPSLKSAPKTSKPTLPPLETHASAESFEPVLDESRTPGSIEPSSYSASSATSEFASLSDIQSSTVVASATAVLQAPEPLGAPPSTKVAHPVAKLQDIPVREMDRNGRPVNKRRNVRIRVSFSACVRHPAHADEVVECENVSKGGVCFHSLQQYPLDSFIEVAAPFSPGEAALFVPGQIKRVEPLSGGLVFRYGVEYTKFSSTQPYSQSS